MKNLATAAEDVTKEFSHSVRQASSEVFAGDLQMAVNGLVSSFL